MMPNSRRFFTESDLRAIEREILAAESVTSGEIVPLVVEESAEYAWFHWAMSVFGAVIATFAVYWIHRAAPWGVALSTAVGWQVTGAGAGAVISFAPFIKRRLIPSSWMREAVHRQCMANFLALGLHETRDRTGVLIFLSLFEHRVEILADRGIHEKTGQGYWESQVRLVVDAIREGCPADGLCKAIAQIGQKLAESFPRRPEDKDEHSNELRFGPQGGAGSPKEGR